MTMAAAPAAAPARGGGREPHQQVADVLVIFGITGDLARVMTFRSLYPRVMVSSTGFSNSLTVSGTASAHYTLAVMTVVALIATPAILVYQGWTYHVFRARVGGPAPTGPDTPEAPPQPAA
jgi:cytochrome d ubiquinol oxidase subunit II